MGKVYHTRIQVQDCLSQSPGPPTTLISIEQYGLNYVAGIILDVESTEIEDTVPGLGELQCPTVPTASLRLSSMVFPNSDPNVIFGIIS